MSAMVERFCIMDEVGRVMTVHGEFSYDDEGYNAEFRSEEEALEGADELLGSRLGLTVERYERWSRFPDLNTTTEAQRDAA